VTLNWLEAKIRTMLLKLRTTQLIRALHPLNSGQTLGAELEWIKNRIELRKLIVESEDISTFLSWAVIRRTMFVGNESTYAQTELDFILQSQELAQTRYTAGLIESTIGGPELSPLYPNTSANLIHHNYSLARYEVATGKSLADMDYIVEFGGGYGSMCRALRQQGFHGSYFIFDLPEFSILQYHYLSSVFGRHHIELNSPREKVLIQGQTYLLSNEEAFVRLCGQLAGGNKLGGFVATWSFSETPVAMRSRYSLGLKNFTNVLIAYQLTFNEVNNEEYFKTLFGSEYSAYRREDIGHLPANAYLFR